MKPLSTCTANQLLKFIKSTVPSLEVKDWYVIINEQAGELEFVDPKTMEIHNISACAIYYAAE